MKKLLFTAACIAITSVAAAQQDRQQPNDDQLQQQAPRETQRQVERAAKVEAVKQQSNADIQAEQDAKAKSQSQRQTKTQPMGMNPKDTAATPENEIKKDLTKPKKILSEDSKPRN